MKIKINLSLTVFTIFLAVHISQGQFANLWDVRYSHSSGLLPGYSNESKKTVCDVSGNLYVLVDAVSDTDPNGFVTGGTYHYTVLLKLDPNGNILNQEVIQVNNHITNGFANYGAFGLDVDVSGNVYIGYAVHNSVSNFDVIVAKYDGNLNLLWSATYPSTRIDQGISMEVDNAGIVYIIVKSTNAQGNSTYHCIKFSGNPVSSSLLHSFETTNEVIHTMKHDGNSSLYAVGYRLIGGFKAALTARIATNGSLVWKKIFDAGTSSRDDYLNDVVVGSDGNVYVAGYADRGLPTNADAIVMKHDAGGGKVLWVKYLDRSNGNETGVKIISPTANFLYVGANSGNAVFIEKLDYAGLAYSGPGSLTQVINNRFVYSPVPVNSYLSLNGASLTDIQTTVNNRFYLTGSILATDGAGMPFSASFLIRLKEVPNSRSSNIFSLEAAVPVNGTNNESFVAVGMALYAPSKIVYWFRDQVSSFTNHDYEWARIDAYQLPAPFRDSDINPNTTIRISPNPVNDFLSIAADDAEEIVSFMLMDALGKTTVYEAEPATGSFVIDMTGYSSGLYLVRATGKNGHIHTLKLIKN